MNIEDVTFDNITIELYKFLCDTNADGKARVQCARLLFDVLGARDLDLPDSRPGPRPRDTRPITEVGKSILGGLASGLAGGLVGCHVSLDFQNGQGLVLKGTLAEAGTVVAAPGRPQVGGTELPSQQLNKLTSKS